jgi:RNA polymerase sigma-70 factor (ECF subfamily)
MQAGMNTSAARIDDLYNGYRTRVLKRARQLLRDEQDAQDATQEVFLRLLDSKERVLSHPEPQAWLHRVTTNLCLNRLRDTGRRNKLIAKYPANDDQHGSNAETRTTAVEILRRVPSELLEIAVYYHADGMTCKEIAAMVGVSRRTIGNRLVEFQSAATGAVGNA